MDELDIVDQFHTEKREYDRTVFLTVICVASFIGSWVTILYYTLYINKVSDIERSVYHLDETGILEYSLMKISIAASFVSFAGAVFMWRMRRIGLLIYAVGQLIPVAMMAYIYGMIAPFDPPKTYYVAGYAVMQVLFVGLYMVSWKKMRW